MRKFYVTTPIYYANAPPHIGGVYTTLAADVLSRWKRLKGYDVFFLTGLDEHGKKIQETAKQSGKDPKSFLDAIAEKYRLLFRKLGFEYSNFIRTTDSYHEKRVIELLKDLYLKGYIYKGVYKAYYCVGCEQYLKKSDLVDGKCPLHNRTVELRKEEAYLFRLSQFQGELLKVIKSGEFEILPFSRRKEVISFIEQGLSDISISRRKSDVEWGIPLPFDKDHTCYVWIDAFWNYVSGLQEKFSVFWPPDVQFMANDILRVHATIWPALLLAAGLSLPKKLFIHGYFTVDGRKMSKSLGNVVDPFEMVEKYGVDALRYFLMRNIPFGQDGDFSEKGLVERYNNELVNKLGNLVSRVEGLIERNGLERCEVTLLKSLNEEKIERYFENFEFDKVLNEIFRFIDFCNEVIQRSKPWETGDRKILYELKEGILKVAELLWPFIPSSCDEIRKRFSAEKIIKNKPLFKKIS